MWASILDIIASALPAVLGWLGLGKAPDGPSPDYTAGEAAGALKMANDNQSKVLRDVQKANAIDRASDADRLRGKSDLRTDDGFRRD